MKNLTILTLTKGFSVGLIATLESVSRQTIVARHIVVDGGSESTVYNYCRDKYINVEVYKHDPKGIYEAMNFGLTKVDSVGYLLVLNAGDFLVGNRNLEYLVASLSESDKWGYGQTIAFKPDHEESKRLGAGEFKDLAFTSGHILLPHPSLVIPSEWIKSLGGFREVFKIGADVDLSYRVYKKYGSPSNTARIISAHELGGVSSAKKIRPRLELIVIRVWNFPKESMNDLIRKVIRLKRHRSNMISGNQNFMVEPINHYSNCLQNKTFPYCCLSCLTNK